MTKAAVRAMDALTAWTATPPRWRQGGQAVRAGRRIEARLDDVDDSGGRPARGRDRSRRDRSPEHRPVLQASLAGVRLLGARGRGLRAHGDHALARDAAIRGADGDRGSVVVPGPPDDAEADAECRGRSVLPAGFVAVLLRWRCPARNTCVTCRTPTTRSMRAMRSRRCRLSTRRSSTGLPRPRFSWTVDRPGRITVRAATRPIDASDSGRQRT